MHNASRYIVQLPADTLRNGSGAEQARSGALVLADYFFLCSLGLALIVAVDPLELQLDSRFTRHLPLLFGLLSITLLFVGQALCYRRELRLPVIPPFVPLILLASLIAAGGAWARFLLDVQNSFLVGGLYMFAAPLAAFVLLASPNPQQLLRSYFAMLLAASLMVFIGLAVNYGVRQVYHELEFLFPPLAVLLALRSKGTAARLGGVLFFLLLAALFKKNTGYLVGLLIVGYLFVFYVWPHWLKQKESLRRAVILYSIAIAAMLLALLAAYLFINRERYLPSGNPSFRLVTYERAWLRFLDSPLWGNLFTGPAAERFPAFDTGVSNNILPTHSDLLDILAHGGVLGIVLWLWAMARIVNTSLPALRMRPESPRLPLLPYAHALACMSLAAIVTYTFNPILLQPAKALILWSHLGLLVGAALLTRQQTSKGK